MATVNLAARFRTAVVTAAVSAAVAAAGFGLLGVLTGGPATALAIVGALFGAGYGGLLGAYDVYGIFDSGRGWRLLAVDLTWALPSTVVGALLGNLIYPFFGAPSYVDSRGAGWLVYLAPPSRTTGFGRDVLQTIGTINLGGRGAHEHVHLRQARLLGPGYLPTVVLGYAGTGLIQFGWTGTVGLVRWLLRRRPQPWFVAPEQSAVGGFWGWIYYQTPIERWAYGTERRPTTPVPSDLRPL